MGFYFTNEGKNLIKPHLIPWVVTFYPKFLFKMKIIVPYYKSRLIKNKHNTKTAQLDFKHVF